jgi:hypothetical protein
MLAGDEHSSLSSRITEDNQRLITSAIGRQWRRWRDQNPKFDLETGRVVSNFLQSSYD